MFHHLSGPHKEIDHPTKEFNLMIPNTQAPASIPGTYDDRVWSPIDTEYDGKQIKPAYKGTIGYKAPYPPTYNGDTGRWGMRPAAGVEIIDVDEYDDKTGYSVTLAKLELDYGTLPQTFRVTARGYQDLGGKSLYRVPADWWGSDREHVEFLKRRFCAMGTHVKTGNPVKIYDDRTAEEVQLSDVRLEDIPELPSAWLEALSKPAGSANSSSPDDAPEGAPNPAWRPTAPEDGIGSRTGNADYPGGLLGYAKDLREAGAGTNWIEAELKRVARDDNPDSARWWSDSDLETLAAEAVKTKAVDPYGSQFAGTPLTTTTTEVKGTDIVGTPVEVPSTPQATAKPKGRLKLVKGGAGGLKPVEWLWEPYVPANTLTMLGGMEGSGKSQIAIELGARVTKTKRGVLILSPEDSPESVTDPRLIAAGADLDYVFHVKTEATGDDIALSLDLEELAELIIEADASLIIIDPIVSVLSGDTDSDAYTDVSKELGRLVAWAEHFKVTVLAVTHVRKTTDGNALNKMMGSRAFTSKPRSVLMTAEHPDEEMKILAHAKCNVGPLGVALGYEIEGADVSPDTMSTTIPQGGRVVATSRIRYLGALEMFTAQSLASTASKPAGRPPKIQECAEFVRTYLEEHGEVALIAEARAAAMSEGYGKKLLESPELKILGRFKSDADYGKPTVHYWALLDDAGQAAVPTSGQLGEWRNAA